MLTSLISIPSVCHRWHWPFFSTTLAFANTVVALVRKYYVTSTIGGQRLLIRTRYQSHRVHERLST